MFVSECAKALDQNGYAVVSHVVSASAGAELIAELKQTAAAQSEGRQGGVPGVRNLLERVPAVRALAQSEAMRALVTPVLGSHCFAVRGILFDKTPGANWNIVWHQDLTIAVRERRDIPGFGPWSQKAGVTHVQPPVAVLERILTVRLHLDECDARNGPLRVLPGSHRAGRLKAGEIVALREQVPETVCFVPAGGALLMRPLLLHASSDALDPRHRRVVHLEFAAAELPGGLEWHDRVG